MKTFTKIIAVLLLLIFLVSTFASSVLADPGSINLTSKWVGESISTSVFSGDEPELYTLVSSSSNFKLWIEVYDGPTKVKTVINGMNVPANINSPYLNTFKVNTDNLGAFGGKDYKVRVLVQNINTGQSTEEWLDLTVSKKIIYIPVPENSSPVMDPEDNKEVTEAQKLSFSVTASDANNDDLEFEVRRCTLPIYALDINGGGVKEICLMSTPVLPQGAEFNTYTLWGTDFGLFEWTPGYDYVQHPSLEKNVKLIFRAYDGEDYSNWEFVTVTINDKNRIPYFDIVGDQQVDEGETLVIDLNGHDLDGDELSYSYVAEDAAGNVLTTATIHKTSDQDGVFRWHFGYDAAQVSPYTVTIWVEDGFGGYRSETFTITVNDVEIDVTAEDVEVSVDEDSSVNVQMFCSGGEGHLTYSIAGGPFNGSLSGVVENEVTYTPDTDYNGEDTFRYKCTDVAGRESNLGTVFITVNPVNDAPVANDDFAETNEDTPVEIDVLANDYDVDENDDPEIQGISSSPSNGNAAVVNGKIEYTPNTGFSGMDSFEYEIYDITGQTSDPAMVVITVNDVEEPVYECNDGLDNDGDGLIDYPNDPGCDSPEDDDEFNEIEEPVYQCSDELDNDNDGFVDYPSDPGCESPEDDDEFNEEQEENNAPIANDDEATTDKNVEIFIDVVANDTDADDDDLTIISLTPPLNGGIDIVDNKVYYLPDTDFVGDDYFTYTISDGNGGEDTANIVVHVIDQEEPVYECNDGLDNDGDGLIDFGNDSEVNDPGCDSPEDDDEFNEVIEEPQVPYTNIKFKSVQVAQEGDYAYVNAHLLNNGDEDLEDLRVTATIYSLGAKGSGSVFALDEGENTSVNVYVPLPYGANPGYYIVKITVKNSQYHDSVYRLLYLS